MRKTTLILAVVVTGCMGVTCTITGPGGGGEGGFTTTVPLDQVDADVQIEQTVGGGTANVAAVLTNRLGSAVELSSDQDVAINDESLSGPGTGGTYVATLDAVSEYTITVKEPTRGVESTTVRAPGDFEVTSPAEGGGVSLSGFTLAWSNADPTLQVQIELRQVVLGTTETRFFGPVVDTGIYTFESGDLTPYGQGVPLEITIRKTNTVTEVAGFDESTVTLGVTTTRLATPLP